MTARFSVTVRQVREDGSEAPLEGELAAALAAPAEQFAGRRPGQRKRPGTSITGSGRR